MGDPPHTRNGKMGYYNATLVLGDKHVRVQVRLGSTAESRVLEMNEVTIAELPDKRAALAAYKGLIAALTAPRMSDR